MIIQVLIAVAKFESAFWTPTFAKTAVNAANIADKISK